MCILNSCSLVLNEPKIPSIQISKSYLPFIIIIDNNNFQPSLLKIDKTLKLGCLVLIKNLTQLLTLINLSSKG